MAIVDVALLPHDATAATREASNLDIHEAHLGSRDQLLVYSLSSPYADFRMFTNAANE
jgi:hypothetical protein